MICKDLTVNGKPYEFEEPQEPYRCHIEWGVMIPDPQGIWIYDPNKQVRIECQATE